MKLDFYIAVVKSLKNLAFMRHANPVRGPSYSNCAWHSLVPDELKLIPTCQLIHPKNIIIQNQTFRMQLQVYLKILTWNYIHLRNGASKPSRCPRTACTLRLQARLVLIASLNPGYCIALHKMRD